MSAPSETGVGARRRVELTVNGRPRTVEVEPRMLLADVLRHELGLTGTHVGCEQGSCGACTVLVDGQPARSCLILAPQADGRTVETIESVARTPNGTDPSADLDAAIDSGPAAGSDPAAATDAGGIGPGVPHDGTAGAGALHPVTAAMVANHGLQCGFCTPGIVVSLVGAHRRGATLDEAMGDVLDGHLCRCTGYVNIRAAVREAWADLDVGGSA